MIINAATHQGRKELNQDRKGNVIKGLKFYEREKRKEKLNFSSKILKKEKINKGMHILCINSSKLKKFL